MFSVVTKTGKTPIGMSESVVFDTCLVGSKMCPFENKLSRPHQTVNQSLTKVMNFRHSIWKKHRCAEKQVLESKAHAAHAELAESAESAAELQLRVNS